MTNRLVFLVPAALLVGSAVAQSLVVPSGYQSLDAPSARAMPGVALHESWQVLFDAPRVQALVGRQIDAILLRRDFGQSGPLTSGSASIVVRLGVATTTSAQVSSDPSSNVNAAVEVFRGNVVAPASPAVGASVDWSAENVVRIPLSTPYVHPAGGLVLEIESTSAQGIPWPLDAVDSGVAGSARVVGQTCGVLASNSPTLSVASADLVLGRTSRFIATDEPGAPAWLLLGAGLRTQPLNLSVLGAIGCQLWVDPLAALGTTMFTSPDVHPAFGGVSNVTVAWPADPALAGAEIGAQLLLLQSSGLLATTNALGATLSASDANFGMVMLSARPGAPIDVQSHAVPVIGFEVR